MLIITLYTKMSEYTQKTIVINLPMSLSFHILHSHFDKPGKAALCRAIVTCVTVSRANNSAVEAPWPPGQANNDELREGLPQTQYEGCGSYQRG